MATTQIRTHNLPNEYDLILERAKTELVPAILARQPSVWSDDDAVAKTISNRLGWLDSPDWIAPRIDGIVDYAGNVKADGITDIVLLGMGGSSLAPEVCRDVLAGASPDRRLHVLDNTHPDAVRAVEAAVDFATTLFVVASKSGTTTETSCFQDYFFERVGASGIDASRHFCAITDPESSLANTAVSNRYRERFLNPADIGGRYSAISFFGLVPAACTGLDVRTLTERAQAEIADIGQTKTTPTAVVLGAALGACFGAGRDKLTLEYSDQLAALGVWVEQLVAESTGKQGVGIVPVVDEASLAPAEYGDDRVFVVTAIDGDQAMRDRIDSLVDGGQAVVQISVADPFAIGAEFVRWEMATALAGAIMNINPFDEPNVTESKNKTRALLEGDGKAASAEGEFTSDQLDALIASIDAASASGDYLAILAYVGETDRYQPLLQALRVGLGKRLQVATTLGFGPRFLHSTGQLHKGGADNGHFVQLVAPASEDLDIPTQDYSFATLNHCQALGDYQVLVERRRRVSRLNLGSDPMVVLAQLVERLG